MKMKCTPVLWMLVPAFALVTACGSKDDNNDDDGLQPTSFVTAADLAPGAVVAFDAAAVKKAMEKGGEGNYVDNDPKEADDGVETCYEKVFATAAVKAEGSSMLLDSDLDFSACALEEYKKEEGFATADFTEFVAVVKTHFLGYFNCEGQDLSTYNGKKFNEIEEIAECNKAPTVRMLSESKGTSSLTGKIKNITVEGSDTKFVYIYDKVTSDANATRTTDGSPCKATLTGAEFVYSDGCVQITRSGTTSDAITLEGGETTTGENVGKATYEKLEYVGLKQAADATTLWYTGGLMNVTYNDWSGTVKFSSGTAEPIFEMKKGTEVVTGTIKAPAVNLKAIFMRQLASKMHR